MALKGELMAGGMAARLADMLGYDTPALTVSAAGNSQTTATQLTANANLVTTVGASQGVLLPNRPGEFMVTNNTATSLTVYPPVGSTFAGSALNAGRAVTQGQTLWAATAGTTIFATVG